MSKIFIACCCITLCIGFVSSCDTDEDATISTPDTFVEDTGQQQSVLGFDDVEDENPCEGMQSQPGAQTEPYHEECAGIVECTQMPPQTDGSCFCAVCGKKAGQSKCLQVQCPQG